MSHSFSILRFMVFSFCFGGFFAGLFVCFVFVVCLWFVWRGFLLLLILVFWMFLFFFVGGVQFLFGSVLVIWVFFWLAGCLLGWLLGFLGFFDFFGFLVLGFCLVVCGGFLDCVRMNGYISTSMSMEKNKKKC